MLIIGDNEGGVRGYMGTLCIFCSFLWKSKTTQKIKSINLKNLFMDRTCKLEDRAIGITQFERVKKNKQSFRWIWGYQTSGIYVSRGRKKKDWYGKIIYRNNG